MFDTQVDMKMLILHETTRTFLRGFGKGEERHERARSVTDDGLVNVSHCMVAKHTGHGRIMFNTRRRAATSDVLVKGRGGSEEVEEKSA